jgi:hypothetical protein
MQQLEQFQYANLMWLPNCQLSASTKSDVAVLLSRFYYRGFVVVILLTRFFYRDSAATVLLPRLFCRDFSSAILIYQ